MRLSKPNPRKHSAMKGLGPSAGGGRNRQTPHRFRHTFAGVLLQNGVDTRDVADLIGDTDEMVRKHYARWVPERPKSAYAHSPGSPVAEARNRKIDEAARLFPELAGYSLLRLHDSAALVGGILDDFSNPKSLPEEVFRQVNGPAVLLADWPRETFRRGDAIKVTISIANSTNEPINGELRWSTGFESGKQSVRTDSFGVFRLTEISVSAPHISHPSKYTLHAQLGELKNSWDFWVFPPVENPLGPVLYLRSITAPPGHRKALS